MPNDNSVPACPQCHNNDQIDRVGTIALGKPKGEKRISTVWICRKCRKKFW